MSEKIKTTALAAGLAVLIIAAYLPAMRGSWHFDDVAHIAQNPAVQVKDLSIDSLGQAALRSPIKTRAVAYLTFAINYRLSGADTLSYHAVNLGIHLANTALVYLLLAGLYRRQPFHKTVSSPGATAVFGAALFGLNPMQVQNVTYIVQRMNLLAALFGLSAIILWLNLREEPGKKAGKWAGLAVLAALALFSKENAVSIFLLIPLLDLALSQQTWREWARKRRTLLVAAACSAALIAIVYAGSVRAVFGGYRYRDYNMFERLLTQPRVILWYISAWFFPAPSRLHLDHWVMVSRGLFTPLATLPAILGLGAATVLAAQNLRRFPLIAMGFLWFVLGLALESSILPLEMLYEHRLYVPGIGLIMAATGIAHLFRPRRAHLAPAVAILLLLAASTAQYNLTWKNEITLWKDSVRKSPEKNRPWENLCSYTYLAGKNELAVGYCGRSIAINSRSGNALYMSGLALYRLQRYAEAEDMFRRAADTSPDNADVRYQLGMSEAMQKKHAAAVDDLTIAVKLNPKRAMFWYQLGIELVNHGDQENGAAALRRAWSLLSPADARLRADLTPIIKALDRGARLEFAE